MAGVNKEQIAQAKEIDLLTCGIQYRVCCTWVLYQEFTNLGYTDSKTYMVKGKIATIHTYWTQAGRYFIYEYLKVYGILPCMEMENLLA